MGKCRSRGPKHAVDGFSHAFFHLRFMLPMNINRSILPSDKRNRKKQLTCCYDSCELSNHCCKHRARAVGKKQNKGRNKEVHNKLSLESV